MYNNNNTLCCHWCGVDLSMASQVTYLNGNLPVCQLCLIKANAVRKEDSSIVSGYWDYSKERTK